MAIKRGGTSLSVASLNPEKYPTTTFDTDPKQVKREEALVVVVQGEHEKPVVL